MKKARPLLGLVLAIVVICGSMATGSAPVSAQDPDDDFYYLAHNSLSPKYVGNGCQYRVMYGPFGTQPYAMMRIYNWTNCQGASVTLNYDDGSGPTTVTAAFADGYTTGTDTCGAYRQVQATGPAVAYPIWLLAVVPDDPANPGWFENWRLFSAGGNVTHPVFQYC